MFVFELLTLEIPFDLELRPRLTTDSGLWPSPTLATPPSDAPSTGNSRDNSAEIKSPATAGLSDSSSASLDLELPITRLLLFWGYGRFLFYVIITFLVSIYLQVRKTKCLSFKRVHQNEWNFKPVNQANQVWHRELWWRFSAHQPIWIQRTLATPRRQTWWLGWTMTFCRGLRRHGSSTGSDVICEQLGNVLTWCMRARSLTLLIIP